MWQPMPSRPEGRAQRPTATTGEPVIRGGRGKYVCIAFEMMLRDQGASRVEVEQAIGSPPDGGPPRFDVHLYAWEAPERYPHAVIGEYDDDGVQHPDPNARFRLRRKSMG